MHTLSPLQFLPPHVVRLIINHVVGSSRLVFDGVYIGSYEYLILLKPLLWVSGNFRAVAYPLYCSYFRVMVGAASKVGPSKSTSHKGCTGLGHSVHQMAKELRLDADENGIYSGAALEELSRKIPENCAFPLVRTFTLLIGSYANGNVSALDDSNGLSSSEDECEGHRAHTIAFVMRVKQILPKATEFRVKLRSSFNPDQDCGGHLEDLVSQLYRLGTRIEYDCGNSSGFLGELSLDDIHKLVHIHYVDERGGYSVIQLAQQNAQTLQSVCLNTDVSENLADLIQSPDGGYTIYPCLHTLKLRDYEMQDESRSLAFPGAAPFPLLRRLSVKLQCSLGDDALFRGNAALLESLVLRIDSSTVSMLRQHRVFTPTSHPRLQCVGFESLNGYVPDTFATYAEAVRFTLSIGPRAPVRIIKGLASANGLLPPLASPGNHSCIQVLSIPSTILDIWQAISLIESLPLLSDLHAPCPTVGTMPDGINKVKLPEYVVSTCAPMGERFRCWHLGNPLDVVQTDTVVCMMLLALLCPNFDISVYKTRRKSFMGILKRTIDSVRFRPYAPRLRRLLFDGWQTC